MKRARNEENRIRAARILFGVMLLVLVPLSWYSATVSAGMFSDAEIKAMPPYCEARYKRTPGQYEYWQQRLGPDYLHTHHLCDGYGFLNRYYKARTKMAKKTALDQAMGTLNYMVTNAKPEFVLMPDVYLNRAQVHDLKGDRTAAIADLRRAIELNPKTLRAYSLAADLLVQSKKKDEALQLVTEGLRENPGNASLQGLYDKLGGQKPYPEPEAKPAAPPVEQAPEKTELTASVPSDAMPKPEVAGEQGQAVGTTGNPWCRFCPVAEPKVP